MLLIRKQSGPETGGRAFTCLSVVHVMLRGFLRPYVCMYGCGAEGGECGLNWKTEEREGGCVLPRREGLRGEEVSEWLVH